jgi:prepilin-type N-terminal cleavage/methylation domain-containing protein
MNNQIRSNANFGFTLVELLVVITILGILMSLGVSGSSAIRNQARSAQARNDCTGVATAIRAFYTDYSRYPVGASSAGTSIYEAQPDAEGNKAVVQALMAVDTEINPRGVVYYEGKMAKLTNGQWSGGVYGGGLFDPWGYTYGVCMNVQSDPSFKYSGSNLKFYKSTPGDVSDDLWKPITSGVGVFSLGKDHCSDSKGGVSAPGILSWY